MNKRNRTITIGSEINIDSIKEVMIFYEKIMVIYHNGSVREYFYAKK